MPLIPAGDESINQNFQMSRYNTVLTDKYNREIATSSTELNSRNDSDNVLFQSAYHGSPYRFDSFTTDKIGTGEGAQAHGWGLYFALDKKGAEGYKRRLGDKSLSDKYPEYREARIEKRREKKNKLYDAIDTLTEEITRNEEYMEKMMLENKRLFDFLGVRNVLWSISEMTGINNKAPTYQEVLENFKKSLEKYNRKIDQENLDIAITAEKEIKKFLEVVDTELTEEEINEIRNKLNIEEELTSTVYEVDIPEDNEMLWENKLLDQQPKEVQDKLDKMIKYIEKNKNKFEHSQLLELENYTINKNSTTGFQLYEILTDMFNDNQKKASLFLNKFGIKGIRYNSRQDGECAVVFDDKSIRILEFLQTQPQQQINNNIIDLTEEFNFIKSNDENNIAKEIETQLNNLIDIGNIDTQTPPYQIKLENNKIVFVKGEQKIFDIKEHLKNSPVRLTGKEKENHDIGLLALEKIINNSFTDGKIKEIMDKPNSKIVKAYKQTLKGARYFNSGFMLNINNRIKKFNVELTTFLNKEQTDNSISTLYSIKVSPADPTTTRIALRGLATEDTNSIISSQSQMSRENIKGQFATDVKYSNSCGRK